MSYLSFLSFFPALHAAWREEKHRYSLGGIPSNAYSKDLQISSAVEGSVQLGMKMAVFL